MNFLKNAIVGISCGLAAISLLAADAVPRRCIDLPPGPGNQRNSEGDFAKLKDGRILFVYTRFNKGGGDHSGAELAARWSKDRGDTWDKTDRIVVKNDGGMNVMSVSLMRLDNGRLAMFYLLKNSEHDCRPTLRYSDDEGETWSDPICCLPEPVGYYVLNNDRAIQLKNGPHKGRILLPLARHSLATDKGMDWEGTLLCAYSDDNGQTWGISKDFKGYNAQGQRLTTQEPGVIELKDGRVLMYIRASGGYQQYSYSSDGGVTWTPTTPSKLRSPVSPASMERLPNGDILCVWNNRDGVPAGVPDRIPLSVGISKDEGQTWQFVKNLEANLNGWYCYIAVEVVDDSVLLGYCCEGLHRSRITKVPISWLYTESMEPKPVLKDLYDDLPEGPFTSLKLPDGTCTAAEGTAKVISYARGRGINILGGENVTAELALDKPTRLGDLTWLGAERFSSAPPYSFTVEALKGEEWVKVAEQGKNTNVGIKHPLKYMDPNLVTTRLRFSCTSAKGVILCDPATNTILPGFFKD